MNGLIHSTALGPEIEPLGHIIEMHIEVAPISM